MRLHAAFALASFLVLGCDTDATPDVSDIVDTECGDILCGNEGGKADQLGLKTVLDEDITWIWRDFIGHSIEQELKIPGHVTVQFFGPELPLADDLFAAGEDDILQPAFIVVDVPSLTNPSKVSRRSFYALLHRFENGTYGSLPFSQGSIVEANHPDLVEIFNDNYDGQAQRGREGAAYTGESLGSVAFETDADGKLFTAQMGGSDFFEFDFAHHVLSLTVAD